MRGKLVTLFLGAVLVLSACGGNEETSGDTVSVSDPETIYKENSCFACHGNDLTGNGSNPDISTIGSKLSKEEIEKVILEGQGNMPKGLIKGEEATAVAEWLAEKE